MECRPNCGGCCIAPSITSALPNMPNGKAAGDLCANLDPINFHCTIWKSDDYPKVCREFPANPDACGANREEALILITQWELMTKP